MLDRHAPILGSRSTTWRAEADCAAWAAALARVPALPQAFIELEGPLGAGKTTFVRHLLRALGVTGRIKSPTYTVLEPYVLARPGQAGLLISHLDFYRFGAAHEWVDAGLRDVFAAPGLKLVEWPQHAAGQLPQADLRLGIEPGEGEAAEHRLVQADAYTPLGLELIA